MWLLRLVPGGRGGRWWCAALLLLLLSAFFSATGALAHPDTWPGAAFFCAILAYITPIFHYVTERTEAAFDEVASHLNLDAAEITRLRQGFSHKSLVWLTVNSSLGVLCWVLQSRLLAGSFDAMYATITRDALDFSMAVGPLPVWVFMFCTTHALVDNARVFRSLTRSVEVDLLDTSILTPFGRMAVVSTLVVIGAQALFPIMWLGAETDPWTTIPGMFGTSLALLYLFFAPVWPLHQRLRQLKRVELARLGSDIRERRAAQQNPERDSALSPLLVYRREIADANEWPFDLSIIARFGVYLIIVPLTWIGAALIENLVDLFISN